MNADNLSTAFARCGMNDADFARMLDDFGAQALKDGDLLMCEYMWDASDLWAVPSDGTVAARMLLMCAAMERQGALGCGCETCKCCAGCQCLCCCFPGIGRN